MSVNGSRCGIAKHLAQQEAASELSDKQLRRELFAVAAKAASCGRRRSPRAGRAGAGAAGLGPGRSPERPGGIRCSEARARPPARPRRRVGGQGKASLRELESGTCAVRWGAGSRRKQRRLAMKSQGFRFSINAAGEQMPGTHRRRSAVNGASGGEPAVGLAPPEGRAGVGEPPSLKAPRPSSVGCFPSTLTTGTRVSMGTVGKG